MRHALHVKEEGRNRREISLQHDRPPVGAVSQPHGLPWDLSASAVANKWLYCPIPYSDHRGRGALGMTCKPNTSPHSICCLINLINGSFSGPRRRSWRQGRETKTDNYSLLYWKLFWAWLPSPIKAWKGRKSQLCLNKFLLDWTLKLLAVCQHPSSHIYINRNNVVLGPGTTCLISILTLAAHYKYATAQTWTITINIDKPKQFSLSLITLIS